MIDKFCQLWLSRIQRCILFRLLLFVIIDWQVMTIGSICSCWSMPVLVLNHPMVILFINDTWNEFLLWLHLSAFVLLFTEQPNTNDCIQLHSRLNMSIDISNTELNWTWLLNISSFVPIQEQRWLYRISLMTQSRVLFSDRLHIVKKKREYMSSVESDVHLWNHLMDDHLTHSLCMNMSTIKLILIVVSWNE